MKVNFAWLRSIIESYRNGDITRARFEYEYGNAQRVLGITPMRSPA